MQTRQKELFTTIRSEGGLLPIEFIRRIESFERDIVGNSSADYHLIEGETILQRISADWSRMKNAWQAFQAARGKLADSDIGTSITREKWLLPLFTSLEYGRLDKATAIDIEGKQYAISHIRGKLPVHLVGSGVDLDKRTQGVAGASRSSPYSMVQEFLNRSVDHIWAFVSNGLILRILRDNVSLTRQAYIEFDLETMFENEVYSDFKVLWLLCHQSRFEAANIAECFMEQWVQQARDQGTRMLEDLRGGVEKAIALFGAGFIDNPANSALRNRLHSGELEKQDYYRQLLRLVYRLIFLFAAEDREVLLSPNATIEQKKRYQEFYSTHRLRFIAGKMKGSVHGDLWQGLKVLMKLLQKDGCSEIGLPPLGSMLWSEESISSLNDCCLSNSAILDAIRALAYTSKDNVRMVVDYRNMGTEELGSVYEALLELHPDINTETGKFELRSASGNERKTTGSYYTPSSLINCLLDSALEPVLKEAEKKPDPEKALLDLKICDPAAGSGHFLIAAAHRIAKRLAMIRTKEEEPPPEQVRHALRDVISRCIYGVDINPMAVELCRISLWMEAMEPGKPLTFIDHHIRCGNSLLGTTPALLAQGIPEEAFNPIEGDDKKLCSEMKKRNKQERGVKNTLTGKLEGGQVSLLTQLSTPVVDLGNLTQSMLQLDDMSVESLSAIDNKQKQYENFIHSQDYLFNHLLADVWCSAFVMKKDGTLPFVITHDVFRKIRENPFWTPPWLKEEISISREQYKFFHWQLEFPDVFRVPGKDELAENEKCGWSGGFDCVLGNPPWERVKIQEKEWFANRNSDIANAPNASFRKRLIERLKTEDTNLYSQFLNDTRSAEGESHIMRNSGRYPLCGRGDINLFAIFSETFSIIVSKSGFSGAILPCGIATDDTTKNFFQYVIDSHRLHYLLGFINEQMLFPNVLHNFKFCLFVLGGLQRTTKTASFAFNCYNVEQSKDVSRRFALSSEDIALLNPNTKTCPVFFWRLSADITKAIYRKIPILYREGAINEWAIKFGTMFHMSNDSGLFKTEQSPNDLPLYEAKMIDQYNHRYASYERMNPGERSHMLPVVTVEQLCSPNYFPQPCYYLERNHIEESLSGKWSASWLLGFREITSAGLWRTTIYSLLPRYGVSNKIPLVFFETSCINLAPCFLACMNSFVLDFVSRQKLGGASYSFFIKRQLPIPSPKIFRTNARWSINESIEKWVNPRVLELTYTSWDLESFAQDFGWSESPFLWNELRRVLIRCELDAAFYHLYLGTDEEWKSNGTKELLDAFPTPRHAIDYIMETFPIVKRTDITEHGTYRTKETILEIYDEMTEAIRTGKPYQTKLDPPPGDIRCTHGYVSRKYHPVSASNKQAFPWEGLEYFVFKMIPHLVKYQPGHQYWLYFNGAVLLADPAKCRNFILSEEDRQRFDSIFKGVAKLSGDSRPDQIRDNLRNDKFISIDENELVALVQPENLIEIDNEEKSMVPFGTIVITTLEQRFKERIAAKSGVEIDSIISEIVNAESIL